MNPKAKKYYNQCFEYFKKGKPARAIKLYTKALLIEKGFVEALVNMAAAYQSMGNLKKATNYYLEALKEDPEVSIIYFNLGSLYQDKNPNLAISYFERAVELEPKDWDSLNRLGVLYKNRGEFDKAIDCYKRAIELNPDFENAMFNLGVIKSIIGITSKNEKVLLQSLEIFKNAFGLSPATAELASNIGIIYQNLNKDKLAEKYYKKAIALSPNMPQPYYNMGSLLEKRRDVVGGASWYKKALVIDPYYPETLGNYCFIVKQMFDWDEYYKIIDKLDKETKLAIKKNVKPSEAPFINAVRKEDPEEHSAVARIWTNYWVERYKNLNPPVYKHSGKIKADKIKVGYVSDGFREFPTTHNITGVFENHDRKKFKIFAYSYGPDDKSVYRKRVKNAVDVFRDVKEKSLLQIAEIIKEDDIDILIDLKGHTRGSRFEFMHSRPAKIQATWLGFVGSSQSDFVDYYIADTTVLPPKYAKYFSEKIVYLPDTYWPPYTTPKNGGKTAPYSRKDLGLPEKAIVFASFNQPYKIEPDLFDLWARILKKVPGSVLWQWASKVSEKYILREAKRRGVDRRQIVFASDWPKEKHLSRLKQADLGFDTTICNGHTTTIDALWAGVPVITVLGKHFASRVSASMLKAMGLPELITHNLKQYEDLTVKLATNPKKLKVVKDKLAKNKLTKPLFDTKRFTQNLEKAYIQMVVTYNNHV